MWRRNTRDRDTPFWFCCSIHSNCLLSINVLITVSLCRSTLLPSPSLSRPTYSVLTPFDVTRTHSSCTHPCASPSHMRVCAHTSVRENTQTHTISRSLPGEKVMPDEELTCDLFRFLQLLCEGHNSGFLFLFVNIYIPLHPYINNLFIIKIPYC